MTSGRKPYGHTAAERRVVEAMRLKSRTRRGGRRLGPHGIARELNEEGVLTRDGKSWRGRTVERILARDARPPKRRPRKIQLGAKDFLSMEQARRLIAVCRDGRERAIVTVMLAGGLRASEVCGLRWRDVVVVEGRAMLEVRCGKGGVRRSVLLPVDAASVLGQYVEGSFGRGRTERVFRAANGAQLSYRALRGLISRVGVRAGLPWLHPHVLRHTFATLLYDDGKDLIFVKDQLGHKWVSTTGIYAKSASGERYEKADRLGKGLLAVGGVKEACKSDAANANAGDEKGLDVPLKKEKSAVACFE